MRKSRTGRWWLLPGLILISGAVLMTRSEPVERMRLGIISFFRPAQKFMAQPAPRRRSDSLQARVRTLENQLLRQQERIWQLSHQLRSLRAFRDNFPRLEVRVVPAEIIGRDTSPFRRALILDAGRVHGVSLNSPVLVDAALVGRVTGVSARTSDVRLIDDPASSVPVVVMRTREQGAVEGTLEERPRLALHYVDRLSQLRVDDVVLTSGVGGLFPKGIVVGEVRSSENTPGALFKQVYVQPAVDLSRLERVLVLRRAPKPG